MCCNPATGKVYFVDDWLSSKAINALCEQIANADQSIMDEETLGAIYLGKKKAYSIGTNSFSCNAAHYWVILPRFTH